MTYPAVLEFDYQEFILNFPLYAAVPEDTLARYWGIATDYINNNNYGYLKNASRQHAIDLMAAHLLYIRDLLAQGQTTVVIAGASIDKVSLTLTAPTIANSFQWWLSTSPYGLELRALLRMSGAGGLYIGGSAPGDAFRKPYGGFSS